MPRHRALRLAADTLTLGLCALALASTLVGGFRVELFGLRISLRSPEVIALIAAAIATLRHYLMPRPSLAALLWDRAAAAREREAFTATRPLRISHAAVIAATFAALTLLILWPQVRQPWAVPDHGDPLFSIWRLSWVAHQLPRDPLHLFDAPIFHPHVRTLAYSDAMLLPGLAAAPLLWAGVHPVLVYNILFVLAIALSGVTTFFLVARLTGRWEAALIAGVLFAFAHFRFVHYSHLELQWTLWMPLALLALHRLAATPTLRRGLWLGLVIALQALSSLYYGVFLTVLLTVIAAALVAMRHVDLRRAARPLAAGALLCALLVVPLTIPYWQNRSSVRDRQRSEVAAFSAVPRDYLVPHGGSRYHSPATNAANGERQLFPGVVPIALTALSLWPPFTPLRAAYGLGLIATYDASLGLNGHLYPLLFSAVPVFKGLRAPARFAMLVALMLSVLAALATARLLAHVADKRLAAALSLAIAAASIVDARPALSLHPVGTEPPPVLAALPADRLPVVLHLPLAPPLPYESVGQDFTFMYFSTFRWHRLVNGASGFFPDDYVELRRVMPDFPSEESIALLSRYGVEYVVIHAAYYAPADYQRTVDRLQQHGRLQLEMTSQWENGEVRLYRCRSPG